MGTDNVIFLEVLEWHDKTGKEIVHRIPQKGSGEVKFGARLIVRESQAAVFFYNGKAWDAFGPGNHHLTTANIPMLNKILSIPWSMTSPLRTEVYFTNLKIFTNLKWGTKNPVAFKDTELGLIRLRAFGVFNIQVVQPVLFINNLVGTQNIFTTEDIDEYLSRVVVSRLNDHLGEHLDSLLNMPGRYDELSAGLQERLQRDFSKFGLALSDLYITSITPPPDVQQAIDDKSRLSVFDDLNKLMQMKTAMALEKAAEQQGEAGAGAGMGMGLMMPAMFSQMMQKDGGKGTARELTCPDCHNAIPADAKFCPHCGHQVVVFQTCAHCGKNLGPHAKFCSSCGKKVEEQSELRKCPKCSAENLNNATYCNSCGEQL